MIEYDRARAQLYVKELYVCMEESQRQQDVTITSVFVALSILCKCKIQTALDKKNSRSPFSFCS